MVRVRPSRRILPLRRRRMPRRPSTRRPIATSRHSGRVWPPSRSAGRGERARPADLKPAGEEALVGAPSIEHVLVARRLGDVARSCAMQDGRDVWWEEIVERQAADCPPVPVDSEHMLYLLYTSGTTAKPKGILHTSAGYLVGTPYTHRMIF